MPLLCPACDRPQPEQPSFTCSLCGGLLEVQQPPLADLRPRFRERLAPRPDASGVWRFAEWVDPELAPEQRISLGEGDTALLTSCELGLWCGLERPLLVKHEGRNPTGSFKDRGMTVAVSRAKLAGARRLACASTGNTAASLAAYAGRGGMEAYVFVPEGKTAMGKLSQAVASGARVVMIEGDFDAAMGAVRQLAARGELALVNSLNPWRLEGQRTIVFELLEACGWDPPEWFVFPAGNLGNCAAFGKALRELRAAGLIERAPRLVAVQASGAAPFAAAFERGFDRLQPVQAETRATAIRIGNPVSYARAVRSLRETDGLALAVDDDAIARAKQAVDQAGLGAELASCASLAGVRVLQQRGLLGRGDRVAVLLTGHLLKDPDANLEGGAAPVRAGADPDRLWEVLQDSHLSWGKRPRYDAADRS